jgi:protein tyrosine phosphatase|tara:strand:- start:88 stop:321 length:234 start_codon:yes stop_codon:yes gene_type:complete
MPINLDSAILSSKTGTYIINVLLTTDLLLKLYKEGKTPSQERIEHVEKLIREIESKRIKAIRNKTKFKYVEPHKYNL